MMKSNGAVLLLMLSLVLLSAVDHGEGACSSRDTRCEFWLVVEARMTMTYKKTNSLTTGIGGRLYYHDKKKSRDPVSLDDVITTDGYVQNRLVYVVNGTSPGPEIAVYENQWIIVHVQNNLPAEMLSMHWHGIHQRGTPWMDGVAFITEWPILPGGNFTYRFTARPAGTHWYHSHVKFSRTMGIYGAFIVHRRQEAHTSDEEHTMMLADFNHLDTDRVAFEKWTFGLFNGNKTTATQPGSDGLSYGWFQVHSGLINGRGRYYDYGTGKNNGAPLSRFDVTRDKTVRLRVINVGSMMPFRFAIEGHNLTVVASDGVDMEPIQADAVLLFTGEAYDIIIRTDQASGNFKISAKVLLSGDPILAEGILHYKDAPIAYDMKDGDILPCAGTSCVYFNCPMEKLRFTDPNATCINIDQAKALKPLIPAPPPGVKYTTYFLNFAYPHPVSHYAGGSVNAKVFREPDRPPLITGQTDNSCDACKADDTDICLCTSHLNIRKDERVRIVLMNVGQGVGTVHSVHLHGYFFEVLKLGHETATLNATRGTQTTDINCQSNLSRKKAFCYNATWNDPSWFDSIPGVNPNPMVKDTVVVPAGGYVVIQFIADNPGYWFLHCHQEIHLADGMATMLVTGKDEIGQPDDDVTYCGAYGSNRNREEFISMEVFSIITGVLVGLILLLVIANISCYCRSVRPKATNQDMHVIDKN